MFKNLDSKIKHQSFMWTLLLYLITGSEWMNISQSHSKPCYFWVMTHVSILHTHKFIFL